MSASESEPEVRERSRTFVRGASKKEIEESLPLIPEVKYPDLKVCQLTPAEEKALFGPPPSWVDLTVEEEEEVKPSRGSQAEGKHRAFEELTQEAYKEYLKEERNDQRKHPELPRVFKLHHPRETPL